MKILIFIFLSICVFSSSFVFGIKKQESVNEKATSILWDLEAKWVYWVDKAVEKGENAIRLDTHSLWTFFEKYANFRALNIETGPIKVFNGIMDKTMQMMLEAVGDKTPYTGPDVMLDKNFDIIAKITPQRMFDAMKKPRYETVWNHFTGLKMFASRMSDILGQCNYFNNDESDYRELLERATKVFNEFMVTNKENFVANRAMNDAFKKVVNEMEKLMDKLKRKEEVGALCNFHGMEVARLANEVQRVRIEEIYGLKNVLKVKVEPYDPESFNVQKVTALINGKPFMECEQIVDFCAIPFQQNYKAKEVAFKVDYTMVDNGDKDQSTITIEEPIVLDRLEFVILDIDYQTFQLVNNGKAKTFTNNDSNVWFGQIAVHSDEKPQGHQNTIAAEFEMSSQVRFDAQSQPFLQFNIQIQQKSVPGRGAHKETYRFHLCDIGDEACENRIRGGQDEKYYEMEVEGKAANRIRRNAILKASFSVDMNGQIVETDLNGNAKQIAEDATKLANMQEEGNQMKICFAQGTKDIKLWCWKARIVQTDKTLLLDPSKFVEELELEEIETVPMPSFADSSAIGVEAHCYVDQMEQQKQQNHHHGQIGSASRQSHHNNNHPQSQQQQNSMAIQSATNSGTIACTTPRSRNDAQPSAANLALTSQMSEYDSAIETMTSTIRLIEQSPNGYSLFIVTVQTDDLAILAMARTIFRHVEDSLVQRKLAHVQFEPVKEFKDAKLKYEYLKECIIVLQKHFNGIMEVLNNDQAYQSDRHFQELLDTLNQTMLTSVNYIAKRMLALYQASIGLKQQSGPALMAEMRTEATQSNRQQIGKKNQQKKSGGESAAAAQQMTAVIKSADHSFSANIVAKVTEQTRRSGTLVLLSLLISIERKPVKDPNYQGTYFQIHFCPAQDTGCQNDLENNKNFHFLMDEQDVQIKLEPGKNSVLGKDMLALSKLNVPGWDRGQPFQMCIMDGTELMRKQANRIRVYTWDQEQMPRLCWTAQINFDKRQIHQGHRRQRRSVDPINSIVFTPAGAKNGSNVLKNTTGKREKKGIFVQPMTYLSVLEGIKNVDDAKLSALNKKATKTMGMVATMAEMGKVPEQFDSVYAKVVEHFAGQKTAAELSSFASRIIENSPETLEKIATKNKEAFGKLIDGSKGVAAQMLAEYEIGNVLRNGQEAIGTVAKEIFAKVGTSMPQIGDKLQLVSQFVPELTHIVPNVSAYLENAANLKANALESVGNLKANALESVGSLASANSLKMPIDVVGSVSSGIGGSSAAVGRIASTTFGAAASAGLSRARGLWGSSKPAENPVNEASNPIVSHGNEEQNSGNDAKNADNFNSQHNNAANRAAGGFGSSNLVHRHQQFQAINEEEAEENSEQNIGVGLMPQNSPAHQKPAREFGSKGIRRRTGQQP